MLDGLRALKATGRKLLLVTGRELDELLGIFPEIGIFDRVVAENGALLYRPESGERKQLGDPPPEEFLACLRANGMPLSVGHTIVATIRPHEAFVLATIAGAAVAALTGGGVMDEWLPQMWRARFGDGIALRGGVAFGGGILMAFGARLAGGCTSGHGISGTLQLNVGSWLVAFFMFVGGIATAMLLYTLL